VFTLVLFWFLSKTEYMFLLLHR